MGLEGRIFVVISIVCIVIVLVKYVCVIVKICVWVKLGESFKVYLFVKMVGF